MPPLPASPPAGCGYQAQRGMSRSSTPRDTPGQSPSASHRATALEVRVTQPVDRHVVRGGRLDGHDVDRRGLTALYTDALGVVGELSVVAHATRLPRKAGEVAGRLEVGQHRRERRGAQQVGEPHGRQVHKDVSQPLAREAGRPVVLPEHRNLASGLRQQRRGDRVGAHRVGDGLRGGDLVGAGDGHVVGLRVRPLAVRLRVALAALAEHVVWREDDRRGEPLGLQGREVRQRTGLHGGRRRRRVVERVLVVERRTRDVLEAGPVDAGSGAVVGSHGVSLW